MGHSTTSSANDEPLQLLEVRLHGGPCDRRRVFVHSRQTVIHMPTDDDADGETMWLYSNQVKSGRWEYLGLFVRE